MRHGAAETGLSRETSICKECPVEIFIALLLSMAVVALLSGCAGVVSATKTTNSTPTPASFQLNSTSINFGKVTVGKQTTQTVSVTNSGGMALNITQVALSSTQFSVMGLATPMALGVGQSSNFTVAVNPTAAGNTTGTLTVTGDSGSSPVVANLSATAVAAQPQLSVGQTSIDFGSVSMGSKGSADLVLSNAGAADLTVSMISVSGTEFTVSGITTPKTISAGQSAPATVTFSPTTASAASGSISIVSNDPNTPTFTLPLSGTGSSTGQLSATPASINFGTVAVGGGIAKQIVLSNAGNAAVKISNVAVRGSGYQASGVPTPVTVNPSESVTLTTTFAPSSGGSASGSITVTSDASNSSLTIALTGTGAQAGLSLSPASFNFGSIVEGQTKSQSFMITNSGTASLTISQISENGSGFSVTGLTTPATLAVGASASFSVLFAPTAAGNLSASLSISSNASSSPSTVALSGTGVAATVTLSANPASVAFGGINAGSTASKNVTISNSGNTSLTISQVSVNAKDFSTSGIATPLTLNAGQSAILDISFSPTASENVNGNITVSSSQGATGVIPVSGSGLQPALTITPASAAFGNTTVGVSSTQTLQLSNSGTGTLSISQISPSGAGFSVVSLGLPISLGAGQTSNFNVEFLPAAAGSVTGAVTVVSNAPNSPITAPLSGTGVAASLTLSYSSSSLGFGNVNTGATSTLPVTVTNTGNANVQISQIAESGSGFALTGASTPVTLNPNQSLTFNVRFSPTSAATDSGTVTVTSNASGSPKAISLSGTGVQPTPHAVTLNWTASTTTVSGYNVYRSTTNGSGYAKINTSGLVTAVNYVDSNVQNSTTYYYVTTSVDSSGNESTYSNQATAAIP